MSVGPGEFSAEQQNLGRVIHPNQQDDEGAGGPISVGESGSTQIKSQQQFARREHDRSEYGSYGHIAPFQRNIRHELEDKGKEDRYGQKGNQPPDGFAEETVRTGGRVQVPGGGAHPK